MEMDECGGSQYAAQIIKNSKVFASALNPELYYVAGRSIGYTHCHQVWVTTVDPEMFQSIDSMLFQHGIIANKFGGLPDIDRFSWRLSLAELTKLGFDESAVIELATIFNDLYQVDKNDIKIGLRVNELKMRHARACYCFTREDLIDRHAQSLDLIFSTSGLGSA